LRVMEKWQEDTHTLPFDIWGREESRAEVSCQVQLSLGVWRVVIVDCWNRDRWVCDWGR
jgi:hypothetical protein